MQLRREPASHLWPDRLPDRLPCSSGHDHWPHMGLSPTVLRMGHSKKWKSLSLMCSLPSPKAPIFSQNEGGAAESRSPRGELRSPCSVERGRVGHRVPLRCTHGGKWKPMPHPHRVCIDREHMLKISAALAGAAQLAGVIPQSIGLLVRLPSQGTCLGCRFGPWLAATLVRGNPSMFLSLSLSLPSPLSKNKK